MTHSKRCVQSIVVGGCFFVSISLSYADTHSLNTEQKHMFPEILEQAEKVMNLKKRITEVRKEISLIYYIIGRHMLECQDMFQWGVTKVIDHLKKDLRSAFPGLKGFNSRNLQYMRSFAKAHPDQVFIEKVASHLPWGHIEAIMGRVRNKNDQLFYIQKDREHRWSYGVLVKQIKAALHKKEEFIIEPDLQAKPVYNGQNASEQWVNESPLKVEEGQKLSLIREQVARVEGLKKVITATHGELTFIYHTIGRHIVQFRITYKWPMVKIIDQLTKDIKTTFPELKGLSDRHIQNIRKFAQAYPDEGVVKDLFAGLPWTHIASIIERVREKSDQLFYIKKTLEHGWSCATLVKYIQMALHKEKCLTGV